MTTHSRHRLALPALFALCLLPAPGQHPPVAETADAIVELPAYKVVGKRVLPPPESWRYASVPDMEVQIGRKLIHMNGYEILGNLPVQNTTVFVKELQLRQLAAALFWPSLGARHKQNRPIILIDRNDDPWADDTPWQPIPWEDTPGLTENQAAPAPAPSSMDHSSLASDLAGFAPDTLEPADVPPNPLDLLAQADANLYAQTSNPIIDGPASAKACDGILSIRIRAGARPGAPPITEERLAGLANDACCRLVLETMVPPPPAWLRRGLGWIIDSMEVSHAGFAISAKPIRINRKSGATGLAPLGDIFDHYNGLDAAHSQTAAAFVQYGLYGDGSRHARQFMNFAERATREPVTGQLFKECFNTSTARMDKKLQAFTSSMSVLRSAELRGRIPDTPPVEIREATQSEAARIEADILLAEQRAPRALEVLRVAYWRGERAPLLLTALAELETRIGDRSRARRLLDAALALPSPALRTLVADARLRYHELKENLPPGGILAPADTTALLATLAKATREGPIHENLCVLIADIVLHSQGPAGVPLTTFLADARKYYPDNAQIRQAHEKITRS
ncbi:MAG: hypothetical protein LBC18_00850 [Opitutaceae bacterium]|nr:hypothetical protein [Opitutaceae bacterium]